MSGVHFSSPSLILPFDWNSVGAPKATPIICPAQPPRTLSSSTARLIRRAGASAASPAPAGSAAAIAHVPSPSHATFRMSSSLRRVMRPTRSPGVAAITFPVPLSNSTRRERRASTGISTGRPSTRPAGEPPTGVSLTQATRTAFGATSTPGRDAVLGRVRRDAGRLQRRRQQRVERLRLAGEVERQRLVPDVPGERGRARPSSPAAASAGRGSRT